MSAYGIDYSFGVQENMDSQYYLAGTSLPVYYVYKNFNGAQQASTEAQAMGFKFQSAVDGGTSQIQIVPPPHVRNVSSHDIGNSNGKLLLSARRFYISNTFANAIMANPLFSSLINDEEDVWKHSQFVGLLYDGIMFNMVQLSHSEVSGVTVEWRLICNGTK